MSDNGHDNEESGHNLMQWRGASRRNHLSNGHTPRIGETEGRENGYDLSSHGPDGKQGGSDDIVNWSEERR